jgi:hypothetical protein
MVRKGIAQNKGEMEHNNVTWNENEKNKDKKKLQQSKKTYLWQWLLIIDGGVTHYQKP